MSRSEARKLEKELKLHYGLEWTEGAGGKIQGKITGKIYGKIYGKINGESRRKLTMEDAREVRRLYATGEYYQQGLADLFGVAQTNISQIVRNKTYIE